MLPALRPLRRQRTQLLRPRLACATGLGPLHKLVADVVVAFAAVEAAGAQAAFFESVVPSGTDTSRCARASRSALCRHARRVRRAAPASPRDNPRLRLGEGSKRRKLVEVITSHGTL